MANLNKVLIVGNLTREPELRHTGTGTAVCSFSLAVNRRYKGSDGDYKKEVAFFNIVVWGKSGENCAKYLSKGKAAFVEGRLFNRSYEASDGTKRNVTEIVADNVQFLSAGGDRVPGSAPADDSGSDDDSYQF